MSSSNEHSPYKSKEHAYVILDQNSDTSQMRVDATSPDDEDGEEDAKAVEIEVHSNESEESLNRNLTKSKFSDLTLKLFSALLYAVCSFLITVINKIVLTTYDLPPTVLGVGQMVAIVVILKVASLFSAVTIRKISYTNRKMWTLAMIYLCNLIFGLGGTKRLPLPMFIALRRFSIAMTAIGEFYLLKVRQSFSIIVTIIAMIGGSFIAAAADLAFNAIGYLFVMVNNFSTAANVVYIKKTIDSHEINKHEILYYSALFTIVPAIAVCLCTTPITELYSFKYWKDLGFLISFITSCIMGYLLMYSTVLCTHYNSPLTTTIVGTLKVSMKEMKKSLI